LDYEQFKEFHDKNPDLDNAEYYAEFPETNKSTIRSWKSRATKIVEPQSKKIEVTMPTEKEAGKAKGYEEDLIDSLCTLPKTPKELLVGLSVVAKIQLLRNKRDAQANQEPEEKVRGSNAPILPSPKPIGANARKFGLDEFIVFDKVKDEIRMEIPMDVLFDPDRNKELGEIK